MENPVKKKDFWTVDGLERYLRACAFIDYPNVPLGDVMDKVLRPGDTLMDIGCGAGVTSMWFARRCRQVWALDTSENAISVLKANLERENITNVNIVTEPFPDADVPKCDVVTVFYVYRLTDKAHIVRRLLEVTGREGLIMINAPVQEGLPEAGFLTEIPGRLGVAPHAAHCKNACFAAGLLTAMGAEVECETIRHDFGQPATDMDDAARFMLRQCGLDEIYWPRVREMAGEFVEERRGCLYVPYWRANCLVHYKVR